MSRESIELSATIPASLDEVYNAWMTTEGHGAFTGQPATVEAKPGGRHSAWNGYIHGWVLEAVPGQRAVFAWRTSDFKSNDIDSVVEVAFEAVPNGTLVRLAHRELPEGDGERYTKGWQEYYFVPLAGYFEAIAMKKAEAAKKAAKKPAAAKPAAKKGAAKKPVAKKPAAKKKPSK